MCNGTVSEWSKECDSSENLPLVKGLLIYVCRQGFESPRCHTFWSLQFETLTTLILKSFWSYCKEGYLSISTQGRNAMAKKTRSSNIYIILYTYAPTNGIRYILFRKLGI